MSIFGFYYISTMLNQAGWPKRRGLFSSDAVVDTTIADVIIKQMIDWAAALGACRPKLALQVITWMHKDKDWEGEKRPKLKDFLDQAKMTWKDDSNKAPHEIIEPFRLSEKFGKTIKSKYLADNNFRVALEKVCIMGLMWGLAYPDRFKSWYESDYKKNSAELPLMQKAGIDIDSLPTLDEFLKESEAMLSGYEKEVDPLPEIPTKLLAEARSLGIKVTD